MRAIKKAKRRGWTAAARLKKGSRRLRMLKAMNDRIALTRPLKARRAYTAKVLGGIASMMGPPAPPRLLLLVGMQSGCLVLRLFATL